ncbi:MAG: hypothetical protein E7680_03310 [Ruminococcaceae bacterium]|nr:hypothetical protein [Oscillospiraceae bacterium]
MQREKTKRLIVSAMMVAIAAAIAIVCDLIPFLNLPFGGGFTIASMLPIIIVAYMYGVGWGTLTAFVYSVIQILISLIQGKTVLALFTPASDDFMGYTAAVWIILLDYLVAYTVLGLGGLFRKRFKKTGALCLGSIFALTLSYLVHILSGFIFYGAWAEWFFGQEGLWLGKTILNTFSGAGLALLYSIVYNGLYMIPEIILTSIAAVAVSRIPQIQKETL